RLVLRTETLSNRIVKISLLIDPIQRLTVDGFVQKRAMRLLLGVLSLFSIFRFWADSSTSPFMNTTELADVISPGVIRQRRKSLMSQEFDTRWISPVSCGRKRR